MDGTDPGGFMAAIMKTGKIIYIKITNFIAGAVHALKQAAFIIILVLENWGQAFYLLVYLI